MTEQDDMMAALAASFVNALPAETQKLDVMADTPRADTPSMVTTTPAEPSAEPHVSEENHQDPERKRRRRRSRRGRPQQEEGVNGNVADFPESLSEAQDSADSGQTHPTVADSAASAPSEPDAADIVTSVQPDHDSIPRTPSTRQATVATAMTDTVAPETAATLESLPAAKEAAPATADTSSTVVMSDPALKNLPAEPSALTSPLPNQATSAAPTTVPALTRHALQEVVNAAGLTWVETDPDQHQETQTYMANPATESQLGRERKPTPPNSTSPLVQVETRHHTH
jgi:ribonuclease E